MKKSFAYFLMISLLSAASLAYGKEVAIPLSNVIAETENIAGVGVVKLKLQYSADGVGELRIHAFEKEVSLSKEQLKALRGLKFNGLHLSADPAASSRDVGYIYLMLDRGFVDGVKVRRVVALSSRGEIRIENPDDDSVRDEK